MRLISLNQDGGIRPDSEKGAAIHVRAMRSAFSQLGFEVHAVDDSAPDSGRARLEKIQAHGPIDLLYERYALGRCDGARFASTHGIPHVVEVNSPLARERLRWRSQRATREEDEADRELFVRTDMVVAVSRSVAAYAVERGAQAERVRVIPNGVDFARFQDADNSAPQFPIDPNQFVVGFHGRLRPWHGFERLVSVVERLVARGRPIHVLTIGNGNFEQILGDSLPQSSWTHVDWVPSDALPGYVKRFDSLVLAYPPTEPCYFSPLKLVEAMAAGAVPIVPDLGELTDLVLHGVDGLVYDARDLKTLEQALETLVSEPSLRHTLGESARHRASQLSWEAIAVKILDAVPLPRVSRERALSRTVTHGIDAR